MHFRHQKDTLQILIFADTNFLRILIFTDTNFRKRRIGVFRGYFANFSILDVSRVVHFANSCSLSVMAKSNFTFGKKDTDEKDKNAIALAKM